MPSPAWLRQHHGASGALEVRRLYHAPVLGTGSTTGAEQLPIKTRMLVAAYAIRTVALCSASPASSGYGHDTQDEAPYEILLQLL